MFLILSCIFGIIVVVVATITIRVAINSIFLFSDRTNFRLGTAGALAETFHSQP